MDSADLDRAATGVFRSAFGMNGHKCSACSRVYVHEKVAGEFLERITQAGQEASIGDPLQRQTFLGPLATNGSYEDYKRYIELARSAAGSRPAARCSPRASYAHGYFARPTILSGVPREHELCEQGAVRTHPCGRHHPQLRRGAGAGQRHRLRTDRRVLLAQAGRGRRLPRPDRGGRGLREPRRRRHHRRLARACSRSAAGRAAARPARTSAAFTPCPVTCASRAGPWSRERQGAQDWPVGGTAVGAGPAGDLHRHGAAGPAGAADDRPRQGAPQPLADPRLPADGGAGVRLHGRRCRRQRLPGLPGGRVGRRPPDTATRRSPPPWRSRPRT